MSLKKTHNSYPQAFEDEAVLMVLEQGYSVADAAKSLGVGKSHLAVSLCSLAVLKGIKKHTLLPLRTYCCN
ncbi:transposase [Vibrio kyushuensis]